ncbi:MAG TPA: NAD(+) diphosphatase [Candidatus Wallbacteria bacterium]|nr:NAD(+) diphosphatase [Candidatus Wallbacteria bacterium]
MENEKSLFFNATPADISGPAFFLVFAREKLLVKKNENGYGFVEFSDISASINDMKPGTAHFIGTDNGFKHYCFQAHGSFEIEKPEFEFYDLRSLMVILDQSRFAFASMAAQILHWDGSTKFCGACGSETRYSTSERAKICAGCARHFYPAVTPAIVVAVINDGRILLAHNKTFANGVYSLIAGFVEPAESLEECVRREVLEETGIAATEVKYFKSQPWPFPSTLMIGFTALYESGEIKPDGEEITHAAWFGRDDLPALPRPGSLSRKMIDALMA